MMKNWKKRDVFLPVNVVFAFNKKRWCALHHFYKDLLGKDGTNPVPNTEWSITVCWRVPVKR